MPLIASGIGVAAFFCFMFSWVELLLARTLTSVNAKPISAVMTRTVSASGMDWGLLAAAGVLTIIPGALVIWFVRNYIARGFALGRVYDESLPQSLRRSEAIRACMALDARSDRGDLLRRMDGVDWPTAIFWRSHTSRP